ncbi:hypothetical protein BH10ACT1_BH10ACT1_33310 [soil metagenome]
MTTTSDPELTPAPGHLARSTALWESIVGAYEMDGHQLELLRRLCEAADTADQARALVAADGLTTLDRFGQLKSHPAVAIERDARIGVARLMRELRLEDPVEEPRLPRAGRSS